MIASGNARFLEKVWNRFRHVFAERSSLKQARLIALCERELLPAPLFCFFVFETVHRTRGIASDCSARGDVARDYRHRADNTSRTERYARKHKRAGADKSICAHGNRRGLQRDMRLREIVSACAEVSFLRDRHALMKHDLRE